MKTFTEPRAPASSFGNRSGADFRNLAPARISHTPTAATRDKPASASLRWRTVLDVLSGTPLRAERRAPRIPRLLTRFASPRCEKCGPAAFFLVVFGSALLLAQNPAAAGGRPEQKTDAGNTAGQKAAEQEQLDLSKSIAEAGTSPVDFTRALELHLKKYPQAHQRAVIEKALAKSAIEANDRDRIVLYGEKVLAAEPKNPDLKNEDLSGELALLDHVAHALLDTGDPAGTARALAYAERYEAAVESMRTRAPEGHMSPAAWADEVDKGKARAFVLEARATGNLGKPEEAVKLARSAWDAYPGAEAARETANWLARLGRDAEAVEFCANAFAVEDARTTEADRARMRDRMGELYRKLHGSEKGLGDIILESYDRTAALRRERAAGLKAKDPNAGATGIMDFTLPRDEGSPLPLASLKGKTVVMDFWATWCGPCRIQHPMIENVKKRFEARKNVVFLSVDADEDHSLVAPFLRQMHWDGPIYFEGGLSRLLNISSIPTIVVLDTAGRVASRMTGFIPERFEDMLTQRIEETLGN
jgi:thiol-disulfide isomerase/thioredoxin